MNQRFSVDPRLVDIGVYQAKARLERARALRLSGLVTNR